MYSYRQAKQIEEKLNQPAIKDQIGFDETLITLIEGDGQERELEEFEKEIAEDKDWVFNITIISHIENGGVDSFNYDDDLFERMEIKL